MSPSLPSYALSPCGTHCGSQQEESLKGCVLCNRIVKRVTPCHKLISLIAFQPC